MTRRPGRPRGSLSAPERTSNWNLRVPESVDAEVRAALGDGETLSSFVREAALEKARRRSKRTQTQGGE